MSGELILIDTIMVHLINLDTLSLLAVSPVEIYHSTAL